MLFFRERSIYLLKGLVFIAIILAAVWLEFRYSYFELAIGRYLAWHNSERVAAGTIWETVNTSEDVQDKLENLVQEARQRENVEDNVASVLELVELVNKRERLVLTRDRFLEIYTFLPRYESSVIIDPVYLLDLIGKYPSWERTLLSLGDKGLSIDLIDGANAVLNSLVIPGSYIDFFYRDRSTRELNLDAIPVFSGSIYPADLFFNSLVQLSPAEQAGIPLGMNELLAWRYRLQRVGISRSGGLGDRVEMGFEVIQDDGLKTYRILGRSSSVLALMNRMEAALGNPGVMGGAR